MLFFQPGTLTKGEEILYWSTLVFTPIMVLCVLLILANVVVSALRKRPIHWKTLRRLSSIATFASVPFIVITVMVIPSAAFLVGLIFLLPIATLRWTFAAWIRHEANPDAGGEALDTFILFSQEHVLAFLMIATPVLILTGTWGYWFYIMTIPRFDAVYLFLNCLYLALIMLGAVLIISGKTPAKQLDNLFAWSMMVFLTYLTAQFVVKFIHVVYSKQLFLMEGVHSVILLGILGVVVVGFFKNALWTKWAILGYVGVVLLQNTVLLSQSHPWIAEHHINWIGLKLAFLPQISYNLPENVLQKIKVSGNESMTRQVATSCSIATNTWFHYWLGTLALFYGFGLRKLNTKDAVDTNAVIPAVVEDGAEQSAVE